MLKKMGIGIVVLAAVLCMTTGIGMAEQSSSSGSVKEILDELKILWEDFAQLKEITTEGTKERLEVARAKEEVLYKLALWQGKLVSELIAEASVRIARITKVEEQVEEQAKINKELQASIKELKDKVKSLEDEVFLAKEIAVAAQIRANQAIKETRELAQQTEEDIAMLMVKVNDLVIRVKNLEKELGVGEKPVIKLKSLESKETSVK